MMVLVFLLSAALIFTFGLIHRLHQTIAKAQKSEARDCEVRMLKEFYQNQVKALTDQQHSALESTVQELQVANSTLSRFTSIAAHQLRSPPRGILGAAHVLLEDFVLPDGAGEYVRDIQQDAQLMSNIVDGLHRITDLKRLGNLEPVPVDLNEAFSMLKTSRKTDPGCTLRIQSVFPTVMGEKTLLMEAFLNLIHNGFKFNRSARKIVKVYLVEEPASEFVTVAVEDNGIGIDPNYRGKLFGLFERLSSEFEGTGVGLYLTQMIVERFGGGIDVESKPGVGSIFKVRLRRENLG